ncbi:hypothetical protein HY496_02220 [Candidatus Woesearchaeota archaeon]|nr:hypothetical protein [Candidatus Woesearchaeota archaeon]
MLSVRMYGVLNLSLILIGLILALYLVGFSLPSIGQAVSVLDRSAPICIVQWKTDSSVWDDLDQCCLQARKQLSCEKEDVLIGTQKVTRLCTTGETTVKFYLNENAYRYCQRQVIW